jgi:hypothetical protein
MNKTKVLKIARYGKKLIRKTVKTLYGTSPSPDLDFFKLKVLRIA